jgi:hypothetical protein
MASIKPAARLLYKSNTIIYVSIEYLDDLQKKDQWYDIFSFCFGKILFYLFIQSNLAWNKNKSIFFAFQNWPMNTTLFIEILAYTIPAVIGVVAYLLFNAHFKDQQNTRR